MASRYLNEIVRAEMIAQPPDIQARFLRLTNVMESKGLTGLREPYVKHVEAKLWEMRVSGKAGIARAFYVTTIGRRVVVLRVFSKKTQQTPRSEIELALKRAKEIR